MSRPHRARGLALQGLCCLDVQGQQAADLVDDFIGQAKDDAETMKEGFLAGGTVFLSKPFTARQLVQVVQAVAH